MDYSIIGPNIDLNEELKILESEKLFILTNLQHTVDVLERLQLTNMFTDIFDIKKANYIPKPEISPYNQFIKDFNIDPESTIMFDDIAKNLVPAKNVGFTSVWIDAGYENFSDDIESSKKFLDFKTKNLSSFLDKINTEKL